MDISFESYANVIVDRLGDAGSPRSLRLSLSKDNACGARRNDRQEAK
jgi:hypothetical protein